MLNVYLTSYLRYSWFRNTRTLLAKSLSNLTKSKISTSTFIFLQSISPCKKSCLMILCPWDIADLRISKFDWPQTFFDHTQIKISKSIFAFLNLYLNAKNDADLLILIRDIIDSRILNYDWLRVVFTTLNYKFSNHLFSTLNLTQNAKNHIDLPS